MPKPDLESVRRLLSGKETLVLSPMGTYFQLKTNSYCGIPYGCLSEVFLYSQVAELQKLLDHGTVQYVLVDEAVGLLQYVFRSPSPVWELPSHRERQRDRSPGEDALTANKHAKPFR